MFTRRFVFDLQNFFYSRKNFMKPTHQEFPHRNFQEEVDFLSEIFPSMWRAEACGGVWRRVLRLAGATDGICSDSWVFCPSPPDGAAYCMGRLNCDCW